MTAWMDGSRSGTLADVGPSLLSALGVSGMHAVLELPPARTVCLLLVDGLGYRLLRSHHGVAPFLASLAADQEPIRAGFPATTVSSLAAIGTGLPSGEHGLVGYSFAVDGELLNALGWHRHGGGRPVDLRRQLPPEEVQPLPTVFQQARDAGLSVQVVAPPDIGSSGLTRAVLRGADFHAAHALGDLTSQILTALRDDDRVLCYAYHPDLDALGHGYGPGSDPWCHQLAFVDQLAATIAAGLPEDGLLVITADHGMVAVAENDRVDFDTDPVLRHGVWMLGGEARARHVYTEPGATDEVVQTWREVLQGRAVILTRDEAIDDGWFGPRVADHVRPRIGDVVMAAQGTMVLIRSRTEARLSRFVGQHGSVTPDEQLVPLLCTGQAA